MFILKHFSLPMVQYFGAFVLWFIFILLARESWYSSNSFFLWQAAALAAMFLTVRDPWKRPLDMREWSFHPETGEYYRIEEANSEGYTIDGVTYAARQGQRVRLLNKVKECRTVCLMLFVFLAALFIYGAMHIEYIQAYSMGYTKNIWAMCGFYFLGIVYFKNTLDWLEAEHYLYNYALGLPPVPPPEPAEIKEKYSYGRGRFGNAHEAGAGLGGNRGQGKPGIDDRTYE